MSTGDSSSISTGYCSCGCGQKTVIAKTTSQRDGTIKGRPNRYILGHNNGRKGKRSPAPFYKVEDLGYDTPCWAWVRHIDFQGYGVETIDQYPHRAHVVYYEEINGPVPNGLVLDHLCRVRHCVNPAHLEAVPQALNVRRGIGTKLTEAQVEEIRTLYATGKYRQPELAGRYGVSKGTISDVTRFRSWRPCQKSRLLILHVP